MLQSLLTFAFGIVVGIAIVGIAWRATQRSTERKKDAPEQPLVKQYLQGLHYVINEESDKALDLFKRMAEVDADTVETHLAMGNLHRRRGEVDRAIRIHEHIMSRDSLSSEHREQAMFALGEDYFRAGLFDRAEATFRALIDKPGARVSALRFLLRIYEQQADWAQAVEVYSRLQALASPEHPTAIAHYYCELAEQARLDGQHEQAREWLHKMRAAQRNFPRGALVRAELAWDDGDMPLAARLLYRVVELHPQLLPVTLQRYARAAQRPGGPSVEELRAIVRTGPAARAELAYAGIVAGLEQESFVLDALPDLVRQDPNLSDVVPALAGDPALFDEPRRRALATALSRVVKRGPRYRCVECGLPTATHFWQCPGCRSWDTLAPVGRVELLAGVRSMGPR